MIRSLIFVVVFIASAAPVAGLAGDLTLDAYLDRVQSTHPFFSAERLQPQIELERNKRFIGRQDWRLLADGRYQHVEPLPTSPFEPERVDILALDAGTDRLFWDTGSLLSVHWISSLTDQNLPSFTVPGPDGTVEIPIGPSTYYRHILRATWSLPLLQNRGGELDRLDYDLSGFDVDAGWVNSWEAQENFLLDVGTTFLMWVLAEEQIQIAQRRLDLAVEELDRTKRQRRAALVDEVDVWRAEAAVHNTQSALSLIESRWKSVQAELATVAGDTTIYGAVPDYDLFSLPAPPDADEFVDQIAGGARVVRAIEIRRAQLARLERGYLDTKRPNLDLNLSGALLGGDDSWGGAFEMKYPDVGVGLVFSYPIGTHTADADIAGTRLEIRQLEDRLAQVRISLGASARSIIVQMNELKDVIEANRLSVAANTKRTEEELKLYNQGRGDLAFVIQARDNVALSELEYAGNLANYHNLVLQLEALSDRLLPTPEDNPYKTKSGD
ncbi:MAG: TolC family protein [Candidatus Latescibacterota bacterium]|jgi:outer membrane protein TolC